MTPARAVMSKPVGVLTCKPEAEPFALAGDTDPVPSPRRDGQSGEPPGRSGVVLTGPDDEDSPARNAVVSSGVALTPAVDDTRARRPGACRRPQPRAKAGANQARGRPSLDRPERGLADPSPTGRPSVHARPVRGRRAADAGRHAIGLLDIGARGRRHGRPQPAAGAPSTSARRPDLLAFYMGYRANRRKDRMSPRQVRRIGGEKGTRVEAVVEPPTKRSCLIFGG
jgi:hypothetical protein